MKRQSIAIISIIAVGSLFGIGYASSTVISDAGIITSNLTVTGTCTGCGGGEGNYSHYSLILNRTVIGSASSILNLKVSNDGSIQAIDRYPSVEIVAVNGTLLSINDTSVPNLAVTGWDSGQSEEGKYRFQLLLNGTRLDHNDVPKIIYIYKNNLLLQRLTLNDTQFNSGDFPLGGRLAMSPNGEYLVFYGEDISATLDRMIVIRGS